MARANSVVLSDWAADGRSVGRSPEASLYELLLLSLLYDSVLIPDEVFVLNTKLASWFGVPQYKEILAKCMQMGSVVVLTHPASAYPNEELRARSERAPILTRAEYIQRFGTTAGRPFSPNKRQSAFYGYLDSCLLAHPSSHRPSGAKRRAEIMPLFAQILRTVLCDGQYRKWLSSAFRGVTKKFADSFVQYIDDPESVLRDLKAKKLDSVVLLGPDGVPVFNRSLAFQAAALYPPQSAKAMQRLVQTAFAAPFAWRERAVGRYNRYVRELLWVQPGDPILDTECQDVDDIVSVEVTTDVSVGLPELTTDIADAIAAVRESDAGRELRGSVRYLGSELTFQSQVCAWKAAADLLASRVTAAKPATLRLSLLRVGETLVYGAVAGGVFANESGLLQAAPGVLGSALLAGAMGVATPHLFQVMRADLKQQALRPRIEQAVQFRCTEVAMPPIALPEDEGDKGTGSLIASGANRVGGGF